MVWNIKVYIDGMKEFLKDKELCNKHYKEYKKLEIELCS